MAPIEKPGPILGNCRRKCVKHSGATLTKPMNAVLSSSPFISSSVVRFSSCLQIFPASESFPVSWLFTSGCWNIELQLHHQSFQWIFRVDFLSERLIWPPCHPRASQKSSPTPQLKTINSLVFSLVYAPTLISIHDYWKNYSLTLWTFVGQVMSLLFNTLSWLVITVFPRSKHLLISWL